jgi:hypothetical protein
VGSLWNSISQEKVTTCQDRQHLSGAAVEKKGRSIRIHTVIAVAASLGLSAIFVVPGLYVYDLFVYGGGDDEFCGIGANTMFWGYDLGCDLDWRQIFVFSAMAWLAGTAVFLPIIIAVAFILRAFRGRS